MKNLMNVTHDNSDRPQIFSLISRVMGEIGAVGKDRKNEQQGYKFRGIEDFYNAAHPALVKHGVFCCPQVLEHTSEDRLTAQGKPTIRVVLKVSHKFYAPDGSSVDVITVGEGIDNSDKASNKAMSGAMKYALIELFSVPTQDVEDADRDSPESGVRPLKNVERLEKDLPLDDFVPVEEKEAVDRAKKLHMRFKEELRAELKPDADKFLADFLATKLFATAKAIPKAQFADIGKEAVAFARML